MSYKVERENQRRYAAMSTPQREIYHVELLAAASGLRDKIRTRIYIWTLRHGAVAQSRAAAAQRELNR